MSGVRRVLGMALVVVSVCHASPAQVVDPDQVALQIIGRDYQAAIQPLLERYCFSCHAGELTEADIDLAVFRSLADVQKQTEIWLKVRQMLDSGQMPPRDSEQPADEERRQLQRWVRDYLASEARTRAGDPGPIVLRRLSNAEYTYTLRDLTSVESLAPASEFPVDDAAGEGFTNVGSGQGMSPALIQKYLDAAKEVADHVVLQPGGIRFSPFTTRRDQTDELLARIQAFYQRFTKDGGGTAIDLQGIKFSTNQGGLLPLENYLAATLAEREALVAGRTTIGDVAGQYSLNDKYLSTLWNTLAGNSRGGRSLLIDSLREKWRQAEAGEAAALAADVAAAQQALWKFNPVGQLGREGGPACWMEAVSPITTSQELRCQLPNAPPDADIVVYLTASDLGDGNENDLVVWEAPRILFHSGEGSESQSPVLLRDVQSLARRVEESIACETPRTARYLAAVAELWHSSQAVEDVARSRGLNRGLLASWVRLSGLGRRTPGVTGHLQEKLAAVQGYEAINGWGRQQTPSLLTNRSDQPISFLTLTVPGRGVTVHPSPTLASVVAWQSPIDGVIRMKGRIADADNQCGNGAGWQVKWSSAAGESRLANGVIDNGRDQSFSLDHALRVQTGDVVSLVVDARDANHACDTTHVEWTLSEVGGDDRVWDLATDIVDNVGKGNPLGDSYGNEETWHFCATENKPSGEPSIAPESSLARWRAAVVLDKSSGDIEALATAVQNALTSENVAESDQPMRRRLLNWNGPLNWTAVGRTADATIEQARDANDQRSYGLDPARFGQHPGGPPLHAADLCLRAPQVIELRFPARLAAGAEFVTTGRLSAESGAAGTVQLQVRATPPTSGLAVSFSAPILVCQNSGAQRRVEEAMKEFRELFPPALCYARIVPVDEVVTLTLFYREDDHLQRLMLDDRQAAELDRLWDELLFVSQEPLELVVAFEQISEFATQDRPDLVKAFAPMRKAIDQRAEAFRRELAAAEPLHVESVLEFAASAWRRARTDAEALGLRDLYARLRANEIPHEEAIRLTLARVLTSPAFLYKLEQPAPGQVPKPVSDVELATRLSYFLWSSLPDEELRAAALNGRLANEAVLLSQTRRMREDPRTRRLAIQFACQWLHLRDFDANDDKNEQLYPEFAELRGAMYEETVRFFEDLFRNDGSILDMLAADHTFLNEALARHYGRTGVAGDQWRRVDGVRADGRGGILGMASFLASQSGASRTSPILRGNWIYETLLGERLPRPPANVPQLPEEVPEGLTARQLIERHSSAPVCAKCHVLVDPYGFALEQYDAIGRLRPQRVDTKTRLVDGQPIEGIEGLRDYLLKDRRGDVVRQFCRKLLGYALGRELQLSDEPWLDEMATRLEANDYRFSAAVEAVVTSPQFRQIRGQRIPE